MSDSDEETSKALISARSTATPLDDFPGAMPDSMDQAYAIQSSSIKKWPDEVAGWKVGMLPPQYRERLSTERLAGPIFKTEIREISTGASATMPIFVGGFAAGGRFQLGL